MKYTLILLAIVSTNCSIFKRQIVCDSVPTIPRELWIDSRIDSWKLVGIADTTTAFISGYVQGYTKPTDTTIIEPLAFSTLLFTRLSDSVRVQLDSDKEGHFKTWLDPGFYTMYIGYVGFSSLVIQNLHVKSGHLMESTVILGTKYGQTEYYVKEDGTFERSSK